MNTFFIHYLIYDAHPLLSTHATALHYEDEDDEDHPFGKERCIIPFNLDIQPLPQEGVFFYIYLLLL